MRVKFKQLINCVANIFVPKKEKEMAKKKSLPATSDTFRLEHDCYYVNVEINKLKETLMEWHNLGFSPLQIKNIYVAAMPSNTMGIFFTRRTPNLI